MSSTQLSYSLLPADRYANTNFRHAFLSLSILEILLTSCNATLCLILSTYIYTRQPFILLHTSFHPFIQASIFMTASVMQFIKLITLLFCTVKIVLADGEIFTACARVEIHPSLESIQVDKSPNEVARRCFKSRQRHVKRLRSIIQLYPLLQLLCGSLSLGLWCTSDERHAVTETYYKQLEQTQGPSQLVFYFYLGVWCADLLITPLFCLITTWHYARVDWQIQLLAAQETMDYNLSRVNREQQIQANRRRLHKVDRNKKRKSKMINKATFKEARSPINPAKSQQQQQSQALVKGQALIPCNDVHTTQAPLSVPVSPSTSSSSEASYSSSHERSNTSLTIEPGDRLPYNVQKKLIRMTASIGSRRASADLSNFSKDKTRERQSTISAYLNVEGGEYIIETMTGDEMLQRQDDIDAFRICIQADDTTNRSVLSP